jgi:hypothetical protein
MRDKREERSDQKSVLAEDGAAAKRPWHSPELQELDVFDTENNFTIYTPDAGAYGS